MTAAFVNLLWGFYKNPDEQSFSPAMQVIVGVLFILNGFIFLFQKAPAEKKREKRFVGAGILIAGILMLGDHFLRFG